MPSPAPRLCTTMRIASAMLMALIPAVWLATLAAGLWSPGWIMAAVPLAALTAPPSPLLVVAASLATAPVIVLMVWALRELHRLFTRYGKGEVFTPACAGHIRRIGLGTLALTPLSLVTQSAVVTILSLGNPVGQRLVVIEIESVYIGLLLVSGLLLVLGQVMVEAARLADDNAGFI